MNRNFVSRDLFGKLSIKSVFESRKLILSRNGIFVGKDYSTRGMIKLSVITNDQLNVINKDVSFAYVVDSLSLWHNILAHIGISTMKKMIKYDLISCNINEFKNVNYVLNLKWLRNLLKVLKETLTC